MVYMRQLLVFYKQTCPDLFLRRCLSSCNLTVIHDEKGSIVPCTNIFGIHEALHCLKFSLTNWLMLLEILIQKKSWHLKSLVCRAVESSVFCFFNYCYRKDTFFFTFLIYLRWKIRLKLAVWVHVHRVIIMKHHLFVKFFVYSIHTVWLNTICSLKERV